MSNIQYVFKTVACGKRMSEHILEKKGGKYVELCYNKINLEVKVYVMNIKTSEAVKINLLINSDQSDMLNSELIETVNSWWDKPDNVKNDRICKLLKVSMIKPEKGFGLDFDEIRRGELLLDSVFKSIDADNISSVETAVLLLDSIYHTRLQNPLRTAGNIQKLLQDDDLIRKIMEAKEQKDIVDCVNIIASIDKDPYQNNNYIYSFATKFCNRLNPVVFPIFDRYVASLCCITIIKKIHFIILHRNLWEIMRTF